MYCIFEVSEVVDEKGDVFLEKLHKSLPESMQDIVLKMGLKCLKVVGETRCERAFWLHKCWKTADPRVSYIIY